MARGYRILKPSCDGKYYYVRRDSVKHLWSVGDILEFDTEEEAVSGFNNLVRKTRDTSGYMMGYMMVWYSEWPLHVKIESPNGEKKTYKLASRGKPFIEDEPRENLHS